MRDSGQQLRVHFGRAFQLVEDVAALYSFQYHNAYCVDEQGRINGLCASENNFKQLVIPGFLAHLQYLNLSDNKQLRHLTFGQKMSALQYLDVSDSRLVELKLPYAFEALQWLDVSRNRLEKFVPSGRFDQLIHLDLSGNQLREFSAAWMEKFPKLQRLYLQKNKLPDTKVAGVEKQANCVDFMRQFRKDLEDNRTIDNEFKILLVGNGGVGKTCLVERLVYDRFEGQHNSTHAVSIEQYDKKEAPSSAGKGAEEPIIQVSNVQKDKEFPYILNLWDFGGQDIYHTTHRLFLQANAFYLVLWDEKTLKERYSYLPAGGQDRAYENFPLHYWLHYIKQEGAHNPVIVVKTKARKETLRFHPDLQEIQEKFQMEDFLEIDSGIDDWDENGFNKLRLAIRQTIKKKYPKVELPQSWSDLRSHLRELFRNGEKLISVGEYQEIATSYGVSDPMEVLNGWLMTSGTVFYKKTFSDQLVILDQAWIIKAIYAIFDRGDKGKAGPYYYFKDQKGRIPGKELVDWIWEAYSPAERRLFVNFMMSCELCFEETEQQEGRQLPLSERVFFAPQMMPEEKPGTVEEFKKRADLWYVRYQHDFLHYGVIQSFIVRAKALAETKEIWKFGMILRTDKENFAVIEAEEGQKAIQVACLKSHGAWLDKIRNTLKDKQGEGIQEWVSVDGVDFVDLEKLRACQQPFISSQNGKVLDVEPLKPFLELPKGGQEFPAPEGTDEPTVGEIEKEEFEEINAADVDTSFSFSVEEDKLIFVQANPTDSHISWQNEFSDIHQVFSGKSEEAITRLLQGRASSVDSLITMVEQHKPNILHFCGHGQERILDRLGNPKQVEGLVFHNEEMNGRQVISPEKLERLFQVLKEDFPDIRLVCLNACFSLAQALAISRAGIFAVGHTEEITSLSARKFAKGFYENLLSQKDIYLAIRGGKRLALLSDEDVIKHVHLFYNGKKLRLIKDDADGK